MEMDDHESGFGRELYERSTNKLGVEIISLHKKNYHIKTMVLDQALDHFTCIIIKDLSICRKMRYKLLRPRLRDSLETETRFLSAK